MINNSRQINTFSLNCIAYRDIYFKMFVKDIYILCHSNTLNCNRPFDLVRCLLKLFSKELSTIDYWESIELINMIGKRRFLLTHYNNFIQMSSNYGDKFPYSRWLFQLFYCHLFNYHHTYLSIAHLPSAFIVSIYCLFLSFYLINFYNYLHFIIINIQILSS